LVSLTAALPLVLALGSVLGSESELELALEVVRVVVVVVAASTATDSTIRSLTLVTEFLGEQAEDEEVEAEGDEPLGDSRASRFIFALLFWNQI